MKELNKFKIIPENHLRHFQNSNDGKINIIMRFLRAPSIFHANPETGYLDEITFEQQKLLGTHYKQYNVKDETKPDVIDKADLVIRCIGYRAVSIPKVPFDFDACLIPNKDGCVLTEKGSNLLEVGHFASGWCKTGANGGLYSVLMGCEETFQNLDFQVEREKLDLKPDPENELKRYFQQNYDGYVTSFEDWFRIEIGRAHV